jgi:hypothetical protein
VTAQVTPVAPGTLIPNGQPVTISNGAETCEAIIGEDGLAACEITPSAAGAHILTALFDGSVSFKAVTSDAYMGYQVAAADTSVSVQITGNNPVLPGVPVRLSASVQAMFPGSGTPSGQMQFVVDGEDAGEPVQLADGVAISPDLTGLALGSHAIQARYLGDGDYNGALSLQVTLKVVTGDASGTVKPGADTDLTFTGTHNGLPVTTTVHIPAGAVDADVVLVLRSLESTKLAAPEGQVIARSFVIEAYRNGEIVPNFAFLQPVTVTMGYNPQNLKESSLTILGWAEEWIDDGCSMKNTDTDAHTITFTLSGPVAQEYALAGTQEFIYWMVQIYHN